MDNLIYKHFFGLSPISFTCPFCGNTHLLHTSYSLRACIANNFFRCDSYKKLFSLKNEEDNVLKLTCESESCIVFTSETNISVGEINPENQTITFTFPVGNTTNYHRCYNCSSRYYCRFYIAFMSNSKLLTLEPESAVTVPISIEFDEDDFREAYLNYLVDSKKLLNEQAKEQEQALQEKDSLIESQKKTIEEQEDLIGAKETLLAALYDKLDEQDEFISQYYEEVKKSMSENNTALSNVNPADPPATAVPALPINFDEISKQLGINFGILDDDRICSTILGTAVKCSDGTYHVYDKSRNVVRSYADLATVKLPSITIPQTSVKPGHNILHANNFYCVSKVEVNPPSVVGTNLADMTQLGIVPQENPLGMPCYTRVISLGDLLGFTGEKTGNTQVVLWILTMVAQNLCGDGLESANAKVSELTGKVEKYTDFLLPVACVAFAAYAMSGDKKFGVSNIAKTAKSSLGIDFDCLKNNDTLKMLFAVGLTALPAIMSFYNKSKTAIETEGGDAQVEPYFDKLIAQVKPLMSKIMKVLPAAIAICAVKLFDSSDATMEKVRMYFEGALIMAKETLVEKFNLSEDFFSNENLKKVGILALVAVVAFVAYRKNKTGENAQASNLVEQVLPKITPFLPLLVLAVPALKNFFADHGQDVDDFDDNEEESADEIHIPCEELAPESTNQNDSIENN